MKAQIATTWAIACLLVSAVSAWAVPMAYEFSGNIEWMIDPSGVLGPSVHPGGGLSGCFVFDSSAPDSGPDDVSRGSYRGPSFSVVVNTGAYSWSSGSGNADLNVVNNDRYGQDGLAGHADPFVAGALRIYYLGVGVTDSTGTSFSSDALPVEQFPLSAFDSRSFRIEGLRLADGATFKLGGTLGSFMVVPEPATFLLVLLSLAVL